MRTAITLLLLVGWVLSAFAGAPAYKGAYAGAYSGAYSVPGTAGGPPPVNLLVQSGGLDDAAWDGNNPNTLVTAGQPDPFGGTSGEFIINNNGVGGAQETSTDMTLDYPDVVVSLFLSASPGPALGSSVRLYDGVSVYSVSVSWTTGVPSVTGGTNDGAGLIAWEGGASGSWFRVWFTLDLATRGVQGDDFDMRIVPWNNSTTVGDNIKVVACQVEPGVYPGKVLQK